MSDMLIDVDQTDTSCVLLSLTGEVDLSHVDLLEGAALDALGRHPDRLVIDLSGVTFLTSSILGALVRIQRTASERGAAFALRRPAPIVHRLLQLSSLVARFDIEL